MSNLSRRLIKEGLERAAQRGAHLISSGELDVGAVVRSLIGRVHPTNNVPQDRPGGSDHHERSLTETVFDIVRSVDSVHDLKDRITSHRGEFMDFARASRSEFVNLLAKITESDNKHGQGVRTASLAPMERSGGDDEDEGQPLTKDL